MNSPKSLVVATIFGLGAAVGAGQARAQGYSQGGTTPGPGWRGYTTTSPWRGYAPGEPWRGYVPGTVAPPTVAPPAPPPIVMRPVPPPTVATTRPSARRRPFWGYTPRTSYVTMRSTPEGRPRTIIPSRYQEFGTGRPIYMNKPWLP